MPVLPLYSIQDTTLWKRLQTGFSGTEEQVAKAIAIHLQEICREAYETGILVGSTEGASGRGTLFKG